MPGQSAAGIVADCPGEGDWRPVKQTRQPVRRRHVPQRTCVACRRVGDKRDLVRVVRTPAAGVQVDLTGKQNGRGAYLCRARICWDKALRGAVLARALKTNLTDEDVARLQAFAATLPETMQSQATQAVGSELDQ